MRARIKWEKNLQFVCKADSEIDVVIDIPKQGSKDRGLGPTPMELMLMGIGACTAADVKWIMDKSRVQVTRLELNLEAERAESNPRKFTKVRIEYVIGGGGLKEKMIERAIRLSQEKYCSAVRTVVDGGVSISSSYKMVKSPD